MTGRKQLFCLLLLFACASPAAGQILNKFKADLRGVGRSVVRRAPATGRDNAIELLAREIDWLEAHLDKFGSVAAKQPDVWGESRLTRFRAEYESELLKQLGEFEVRDNAAIIRNDLAFLANATGVGLALDAVSTAPNVNANLNTDVNVAPDTTDETPQLVSQGISISNSLPPRQGSTSVGISATDELNQLSRYVLHLQQLRRINSGDDTSDAPGYALNLVRIPVSIAPGRETRRGYGAEVTITARPHLSNALLPETFHDLVINDMVDQLGLPLLKMADNDQLRFYQKTQEYRAKYRDIFPRLQDATNRVLAQQDLESTVAGLLESVFQEREFAFNLGAMQIMGDEAIAVLQTALEPLDKVQDKQLICSLERSKCEIAELISQIKILACAENQGPAFVPPSLEKTAADRKLLLKAGLTKEEEEQVRRLIFVQFQKRSDANIREPALESQPGDQPTTAAFAPQESGEPQESVTTPPRPAQDEKWSAASLKQQFQLDVDELQTEIAKLQAPDWQLNMVGTLPRSAASKLPALAAKVDSLNALLDQLFVDLQSTINPVSRKRPSTMPIPQLMMESVMDSNSLSEIALNFRTSYEGRYVAWNEPSSSAPRIHLGDARDYLRAGLEAAYRVVAHRDNRDLLCRTIESGLADIIRRGQTDAILVARTQFYQGLDAPGESRMLISDAGVEQLVSGAIPTVVRNLAWAVVVEMALLNEQLNDDVHAIRLTRGDCGCHPTRKFAYYLPMPTSHQDEIFDTEFQAAAAEFQEYVRCRWPIHIFHVDPVAEDQNVRESSLIQRELAVAAAVGLASGRLNFLQANQFVRAYQEQIDTVALNRTINGFFARQRYIRLAIPATDPNASKPRKPAGLR